MNTQHVNLNIPLTFNQVIDIVKQLSPKERTKLQEVLMEAENNDEYEIPEEHKNIVRQRTKASQADPSRLLSWDEVKHNINV
jgi:putative addiction module component (TIGR02574 family)